MRINNLKKVYLPQGIDITRFKQHMIFCVEDKVAGIVDAVVESQKGDFLVLRFYDRQLEENLSEKMLKATFLQHETIDVEFEHVFEDE